LRLVKLSNCREIIRARLVERLLRLDILEHRAYAKLFALAGEPQHLRGCFQICLREVDLDRS
jgi:hypothetical protein